MIRARFIDRPNRFVVTAVVEGGETVAAYLPNTARLADLLRPGVRLLVDPVDDRRRRTRYTVTRVWDGCWVAIDAAAAAPMMEAWLGAGGSLPGLGAVSALEREVALGDRRIDLFGRTGDGTPTWIEVKSLSRSRGGDAVLSGTPSIRGAAHLDALAVEAARPGSRAAVVFVAQRPDVRRLVVAPGPGVDPVWVDAVVGAAAAGVHVIAVRCRVTAREIGIDRPIPVVWDDDARPGGSRSP